MVSTKSLIRKRVFKISFITLFLDLVGFSLIFPLFPEMLKYYLSADKDNIFLNKTLLLIDGFKGSSSHYSDPATLVFFAGILGAIYSLFQFFASPFWGGLSDRFGRRVVLLITVFGIGLSHLLWFFSGSFTLLIFARFLGGVMAGNISTVSATIADITDRKTRSSGMAIIGIAFSLGFILGPAIGALLSYFDFTLLFPDLVKFGINPFSSVALFAFLLSMINFVFLFFGFKETHINRGVEKTKKLFNIFSAFKIFSYKGVNLTIYIYFFYTIIFSGMEFTLTFLTFERFSYLPISNAYLFIFIGVIVALIQGGFVRRKASEIGEIKLVFYGIAIIALGLLVLGLAMSEIVLYLSLLLLGVGTAIVMPCLSSLVSLYSPSTHQGEVMGAYRALGALARVLGPLGASLCFWLVGSQVAYIIGVLLLLIPFLMTRKLPLFTS